MEVTQSEPKTIVALELTSRGLLAIPQVYRLDSEPDVIIALPHTKPGNEDHATTQDARHLVYCSSEVLRNASPVFAKLLTGNFREATLLREAKRQKTSHEPPTIELYEDSNAGMIQLLHFLHHYGDLTLEYRGRQFDFGSHSSRLATVAIQAHKYDCVGAIRSWISYRGLLLLPEEEVSHVDISVTSWIMISSVCRWPGNAFSEKLRGFLSWTVRLDWLRGIKDLPEWPVQHIFGDHEEVVAESVVDVLTELQEILYRSHEVLHDERSVGCGYSKCHNESCSACSERNGGLTAACAFREKDDNRSFGYCDSASRYTNYFDALKAQGLWPSLALFKTHSPNQIHERLKAVRLAVRHSCSLKDQCPLIKAVNSALEAFDKVKLRVLKG